MKKYTWEELLQSLPFPLPFDSEKFQNTLAKEGLVDQESRKLNPEIAIPAFISLLSDEDFHLRYYEAAWLGGMREEARAAIPNLMKALRDENEHVCKSAKRALEKIAPDVWLDKDTCW